MISLVICPQRIGFLWSWSIIHLSNPPWMALLCPCQEKVNHRGCAGLGRSSFAVLYDLPSHLWLYPLPCMARVASSITIDIYRINAIQKDSMEDPTADNMPASRCWNEYMLLIIMYLRDDVPGVATPGTIPIKTTPRGSNNNRFNSCGVGSLFRQP